MTRRVVRVQDVFYDDLDRQLGPERGPGERPSSTDFLRFDLVPLIELIAEGFDQLPEALPGHPEHRILVTSGRLVPRVSILAMRAPDGSVELIQLDLDLSPGAGSA